VEQANPEKQPLGGHNPPRYCLRPFRGNKETTTNCHLWSFRVSGKPTYLKPLTSQQFRNMKKVKFLTPVPTHSF
jgi:hypothetical protein